MKKRPLKILIILIFILFTTQLFSSQKITFMIHDMQGKYFIDENNEIRGIPNTGRRAFNLELVREMMIRMNHPIACEILPFRRALEYVKENKKPYALFNIGKRKSREGFMKWVGPLQVDKIYFYENVNNPTNIKTFEDTKNVDLICTLNGSFHEKVFRKNDFTNLNINISYSLCFQMLAIKRVDLTVISEHSINEVLKSSNIDKNLIKRTDVILSTIEGQIAFSNMVKDETINKWQAVLDEIKSSGKYDELAKKYLYKYK